MEGFLICNCGRGNPGGGAGGQQSRRLQARHGPASQRPQVRHRAARGRGKPWTLPVAGVCQGPLSTHDCARGWRATVQDGRSSLQRFPQLAGKLKCQPLCRALRSVGGGLPRSLHVPDKMPAGQPELASHRLHGALAQSSLAGVRCGSSGPSGDPAGPTLWTDDPQTGLCPSQNGATKELWLFNNNI